MTTVDFADQLRLHARGFTKMRMKATATVKRWKLLGAVRTLEKLKTSLLLRTATAKVESVHVELPKLAIEALKKWHGI